jgi:intracellular septation protein
MKFVFDLFPILLFFAAFKVGGIYIATGAAIGATCLQVGWVWLKHGKVDTMLWVSLGVIVIFGGGTLLEHDEIFIKWKPTVLDWMTAAALIVSATIFRQNLIRKILEQHMELPDRVWERLNSAWAAFFATTGAANLFIAYHYPTETWIDLKVFGGMGLTVLFMIAQGFWLAKYVIRNKP